MANYLKYTDVPIFANFVSENTAPVYAGSAGVFAATEASLTLDSNVAPNRYLGKAQLKSDYTVVGPLEGKFSMTFIPLIEYSDNAVTQILNVQKQNQLSFFNLTGNFLYGHQIRVSNFVLKQCYLNGYSIKINSYQPVSITANFTVYNVTDITNTTLSGFSNVTTNPVMIAKNPTVPYYESLHALTTTMDGGESLNLPQTKISIDVGVDCNRTPIYTLGQSLPDSVVLNSVERTTNIQGENIGRVVGITGANAGNTSIYFLPLSKRGTTPSISEKVLYLDINGRITSQQLSIAQNSMLNGKVVIKEIIL